MKSSLACALMLVLGGLLTCCGDNQATSCPGCPLSVTVGPAVSPDANTVKPSPTPVPTPTPQVAIPVPTPTPTTMVCTGTANACATMADQATCNKAVGCAYVQAGCTPYICTDIQDQYTCAVANCGWNLVCTGAAASCYGITNSVSCNRQSGCEWQASQNACVGAAVSCDNLEDNVATCTNQVGCGVASSPCNPIAPVAQGCNSITNVTQCKNTNGCYYATAECGGTPQACENFNTAAFCVANAGCTWSTKP